MSNLRIAHIKQSQVNNLLFKIRKLLCKKISDVLRTFLFGYYVGRVGA